jgi:hypothetical protein
VKAAGRNWFQEKDGKLGYLGQSSAPLYFGLGGTAKIEEIRGSMAFRGDADN